MKQIKATIPFQNNYFIYVAPAPKKDKFEALNSNEPVEIITNNEKFTALPEGFFVYPYKFMSDAMCKLSYGYTAKEMQQHLARRFGYIHPNSKIGFFIFKKMGEPETIKKSAIPDISNL